MTLMKNLVQQSLSAAVVALVVVASVTPSPAQHGAPAAHGPGSVVDSVVAGGAAEAAGLKAGDRILTLDGKPFATRDDLEAVQAGYRPGQTVPLEIERDEETVKILISDPDAAVSAGRSAELSAIARRLPAKQAELHALRDRRAALAEEGDDR